MFFLWGLFFFFLHFISFFLFVLVFLWGGFIFSLSFSLAGMIDFDLIFVLDYYSVSFFFFFTLIVFVVFFYVDYYLHLGEEMRRFFFLVLWFVISMVILVFSPSGIGMLLGWDGLGMSSLLLVIMYMDVGSFVSGFYVFLNNRFGDVLLVMAFYYYLTLGDYFYWFFFGKFSVMFFFMFVFALFTKSAQYPFLIWLPLAMSAPTPVSSLVHSSTLVVSGVYLMIRFGDYLIFGFLSKFVFFLSFITMWIAGFLACWSYDLKKLIAFSTMSQLGFMMLLISFGELDLGFFLLISHAIYKSFVFLVFGVFMILGSGFQDLRFMGLEGWFFCFLFVVFLFGSFLLSGFPFVVSFYLKDCFFGSLLMGEVSLLFYFLFYVSCFFTCFYSFRLVNSFYSDIYSGGTFFWGYMFNLNYVTLLFLLFYGTIMGSVMFGYQFFLDLYFFSFFDLLVLLTLFFFSLLVFLKFSGFSYPLMMDSFFFMDYIYYYCSSVFQLSASWDFYLDQVWLEFFSLGLLSKSVLFLEVYGFDFVDYLSIVFFLFVYVFVFIILLF